MNISLIMLFVVTILAILSFVPYFFSYLKNWGISGIVGNRDDVPSLPAWAERAQSAHQNLTENYAHFAVLVLMANYLSLNSPLIEAGSIVFFLARVVYLIVYIAGISWVRTIAFVSGVMGELMIAFDIFQFMIR